MTDVDVVTSSNGSPPGDARQSVRKWRLQRRLYVSAWRETVSIALGMGVAVAFCGLLIAVSGSPVLASYRALFDGAFGSREATYETLVQSTPLIFTGAAAAVAFRAQVWNIGAEGQFFAGAMGAFFVSNLWGNTFPRPLMILVILIAAGLAGAGWASIAGVLKARYEVNEIITTVMLNFIAVFLLSYLLSGVWRAEGTYYFQTERMPESTWLPQFFGSRLHLGLAIALVVVFVSWWVLQRTSFGYEIRGVGVSKTVARYAGINNARTVVSVMALSGAIAGFAGAVELTGIHHRLQLDISNQLGFTGIIIALVARLSLPGVVVVAIGAGAIRNGATTMQVTTGVPAALVDVLLGITLVCVLIAAVAVQYDLVRVEHHE